MSSVSASSRKWAGDQKKGNWNTNESLLGYGSMDAGRSQVPNEYKEIKPNNKWVQDWGTKSQVNLPRDNW